MSKKEEILKLYYDENIKIIDIVNAVGVSRAYISKIIKDDARYEIKKQKQKEERIERKKAYTNKKMKETREIRAQENAFIRQQHLRASRELSGGHSIISNRAFLKWNSSAYKYNQSKNRYEFDKKLTRSYAVPKYIRFQKWKKLM